MHSCPMHSCHGCPAKGVNRRQFLAGLGALGLAAPGSAGLAYAAPWRVKRALAAAQAAARQAPIKTPLKVQPVLTYTISQRREATSWRPWGGLLTEQDAAQEKERIGRELAGMARAGDFPLEVLPLAVAQTLEQAAAIAKGGHDAVITYAAGGAVPVLEALTAPGHWNLMFVRHRSGPVYLWYEVVHPRLLRKTVDEFSHPAMDTHDIVVDDHAEILWRLRGLYGLKNALGKRVVAVGGPGGWGAGGKQAPDRARQVWKFDIRTVTYPELGERIQRARQNSALVKRAHAAAEQYLGQKGVRLETSKHFVLNAFVLTEVFRDLLDEAGTDAITINQCMGTIMPMSETTACLPLSILNDEGYMAFCESDFVVIPAGVLLHYISGRPVFFHNPTYPHDGQITLAHCTAPRKMDGKTLEPVRILTHFESDYGASPKVEMRKGQRITSLIPDFSVKKWTGLQAEIVDNPFLHICRTQIDVAIKGNAERLMEEMRGFHWMSAYGDYLRESGYAIRKLGVDWHNLSA